MDFLKKHTTHITLSTLGVLGAASLIFFYRRNSSKETAQSLPADFQADKTQRSSLKTIQQKLIELSNAVPKSTTIKQQISESIYNYIFSRTAEIQQNKILSIRRCCQLNPTISNAINGIIDVLKVSEEYLKQLGQEVAKLLEGLALSTDDNHIISEGIQNLQLQHQQKIKAEYFAKAREYLKWRIDFIQTEAGKDLVIQVEQYSGYPQDIYRGAVLNTLLDYSFYKKTANLDENYFCLSIAIIQSQQQLGQELNAWSAKMQEIYQTMNETH